MEERANIEQIKLESRITKRFHKACADFSLTEDGDKILIKVEGSDEVEHQFEIDVKQLAGFDRERNPDGVDRPLLLDNGEALLMIDDFNIVVFPSSVHYMFFSGILFTK